jgi:type IV pilus assembly protein PilE
MGFRRTAIPRPGAGFTLIEVMITVAIIAILAAIALPSYQTFVMRSKIIGATSRVGDLRTQMEKFFMDNRTYLSGILCGAQPSIAAYNADPASDFTITCPGPTATTYTLQADGIPARGMGGFQYTVDQANNKVTATVPAGWAGALNTCWVIRKDGSC